jgi:transcriptional regulator GlxA family with amidase domain
VPLTDDTSTAASTLHVERHFDVAEIAQRWNLSPDTIRRLFENEPGVLVLGETRTIRGKRRYLTLRIPESVVARVHRRLSRV